MKENIVPFTGSDFEDEGFGVDVKKTVARFIDNWKTFLVFVIITVGIAYLYLQHATPNYKINATLMIQDPDKGGDPLSGGSSKLSDLGDLFGTKSSVDNEAMILQTGDLPLDVAKELKLYAKTFRKERFKTVELHDRSPFAITLLSSVDSINATTLDVKPLIINNQINLSVSESSEKGDSVYQVKFDEPFQTLSGNIILISPTLFTAEKTTAYEIDLEPLSHAASALQKSLSVDIPSKEVTTINLQLQNSDRHHGVIILTTLINDYIHRNIIQKNAYADSTIEFINNRISIVNNELTGIEKKVQTFQEVNKIADIKEQSDQVIDNENSNQKDLTQAEVQKQIVESSIKYLQDDTNNQRPVPSLLASPDPTFLVLLQKYNTLLVQADRMSMGSTEQNPMVINLNSQIANLRLDLITNLKNQLSALNIGISKLESQNADVNSFIQSVPEKQRQYLGLSREQDIKQALFIYLLQKKEEVAVTEASNISSCIVIDTPKADEIPSSPRKGIIYAVAVLSALVISYFSLLFKDILNNKITSPKDMANTPAISLGEVGHNPEGSSIIFHDDQVRSVIAEQFRSLRTNLQFTLGASNCPIILVTSSMSGEGKSFISTNLAIACALNGKKVLLMELDLRKPKLASQLNVTGPIGFSNYMVSSLEVKDIIYKTDINSNLDLLTAGPIPPNPAELLSGSKVQTLISQLKKYYDLIIIDSAPIGLVTDAQLLVPFADLTMYIVRQNHTFKHQLNIVNNLIDTGKISKIYTVMNDAKPKASSRYGYDAKSSYGYTYGYEGYTDQQKKTWWKKIFQLTK